MDAGVTALLAEITRDNVRAVCRLEAGDDGVQVAPNAVSLAEAYVHPEAWPRAVCVDDQLVGFVMLYDPTLSVAPQEPHFFLWRLMIDRAYQGKGYGRAAVQALIEHVRSRPHAEQLRVSHVRQQGRLGHFYASLGFTYTGEEDDGELLMARRL